MKWKLIVSAELDAVSSSASREQRSSRRRRRSSPDEGEFLGPDPAPPGHRGRSGGGARSPPACRRGPGFRPAPRRCCRASAGGRCRPRRPRPGRATEVLVTEDQPEPPGQDVEPLVAPGGLALVRRIGDRGGDQDLLGDGCPGLSRESPERHPFRRTHLPAHARASAGREPTRSSTATPCAFAVGSSSSSVARHLPGLETGQRAHRDPVARLSAARWCVAATQPGQPPFDPGQPPAGRLVTGRTLPQRQSTSRDGGACRTTRHHRPAPEQCTSDHSARTAWRDWPSTTNVLPSTITASSGGEVEDPPGDVLRPERRRRGSRRSSRRVPRAPPRCPA